LLSTSIQAAMLIARTLDPNENGYSSGVFGRRLFVFTDDLDVTNRLFDDLRDAESYDLFGRPDPTRQPLAALRAGGPDGAVRDRDGQRWRMCEQVGHDLRIPLVVGRTTSQDSGVNAKANVIVATAALEVGFNDPHVGGGTAQSTAECRVVFAAKGSRGPQPSDATDDGDRPVRLWTRQALFPDLRAPF
jgi:hypothetical protein